MEKTNTQVRLRKLGVTVGLIAVVAAGFAILTGCAGTLNDTVSMGRQVHSMTPCGMMMEGMMEHGTDGHGAHEAAVSTDSAVSDQTAPTEAQPDHSGH